MNIYSVIRQILKGPTVRHLLCYSVTEETLDYSYLNNIDISIKKIGLDECKDVIAIRDENVKRAFEFMCTTSQIILAKWNGQIAGHAVLKPCGVKGRLSGVWKNRAYIHYCFVAPQYRGKNIYPNMLIFLSKAVFSKYPGTKVYISVERKNYPSIRGIEKCGFIPWAKLTEYGWGNIVFLHVLKEY